MQRKLHKDFSTYFRHRTARDLPDSYITWDLETTGFRKNDDLIVEIGHCVVKARQPVQRMATLLDWTRSPHVDEQWLRDRLDKVKRHVEREENGDSTGRYYHITFDRLREEGVPPEEAFGFYTDLFHQVHEQEGFFLGQNIYSFDADFFQMAVKEWTGVTFVFDPDIMIDVGALEKAAQLGLRPFEDETLERYFRRVATYRAKGVKWSIEDCARKYGLVELHGLNLDELHGAGEDSYLCYLLFEHFRSQQGPHVTQTA